jgi:hypothetical protein
MNLKKEFGVGPGIVGVGENSSASDSVRKGQDETLNPASVYDSLVFCEIGYETHKENYL